MKYWALILLLAFGCAGKGPLLVKYENEVAAIEARAARGEITQLEADNLKLEAQQNYLEARRREEKLFNDDTQRLIDNQNQDIAATMRQAQEAAR